MGGHPLRARGHITNAGSRALRHAGCGRVPLIDRVRQTRHADANSFLLLKIKRQVAILAAGIPGIMAEWAQGIGYHVVLPCTRFLPALERPWARSSYKSAFPPATCSCSDVDDFPDMMAWRRR
jgi:hypothetical protein